MATAFFPSTISTQIRLHRTHSLSLSSAFFPTTTTATTTTILSSSTSNRRAREMVVRMGGGPRTFPGGVSKWQWKRMQQKKAKQLLKARLLRERQIYEMRKRAELKAALSQLERPWEAVQQAPNLLSIGADEQVKTLADRFQKPGGFDMWNERDGPQVFKMPAGGLPSVRFFPKGAVHSIKPYSKEGEEVSAEDQGEQLRFDDWIAMGAGGIRKSRPWRNKTTGDVECTEGVPQNDSKENYNVNQRRNGLNRRNMINAVSTMDEGENVSKNFSRNGGKGDVGNRNFVRNQRILGSFGKKRGDMEHRQGVRKNVSKNKMGQLKPVEVEDVKATRNKRYTSTGNTKFREVTLRPSSLLSDEQRRIKK